MNETNTYNFSVYSAYDPTRTTSLRNQFVKDLRSRFVNLCHAIYQKVVTEDCFGSEIKTFASINTFASNTVSRAVFAFPRSAEKVDAFMQWLRTQVDEGILTVKEYNQFGSAIESAWTNMYITDSYKRGVIRARYELQKAGYNVPSIDATGGIGMSMFVPLHMDRVGLLYTRVYSDLKGITTAMDAQISRILAQGMADGDGPILLAKKMVSAINGTGLGDLGIKDTLGRFIPAMRRAEILARTEIIRAHHQGMIQEYRNWALEGVVIQAEVVTAGDDRVCGVCDGIAGNSPYTLDEAENLIPVHPQCRCIALPFEVGVDKLIKR